MKKVTSWLLRLLAVVYLIAALLLGLWSAHYMHKSNPATLKQYETTNPHIFDEAQLSAHRSGAGIQPEETMAAFRYCAEEAAFDVRYYEFDLHMTADGELVLLHDHTLDRTSDSVEVFGETGVEAKDKTLAELKQLNMAAQFTAPSGEMPYAGLHGDAVPDEVRIVTLDEVLTYLSAQGDFGYIIEIKDSGAHGITAMRKLCDTVRAFGLERQAIVSSFHVEVLKDVDTYAPDLLRGCSKSEMIDFVLAAMTNRKDYHPDFDVVQMPYGDAGESYGINLGLTKIINYAHAHNVAVQYWTINDPDDMAYLAGIGADAIVTDYPDRYPNP